MRKSSAGGDMKTEILAKPFVFIFVFILGCTLADVKVEVMSERTTLENQVLGAYNSLDSEMLLAASVRGVDSKGRIRRPPKHSREHKDAVASMQVLAFHDDDLQAFKRLGWAGENAEGTITAFPMDKASVPEDLKVFAERYKAEEFDAVISQVNEAREAVMRRVVDLNENMSEKNMPEVRRIFGKLNRENARPGEKIQMDDGTWKIRE